MNRLLLAAFITVIALLGGCGRSEAQLTTAPPVPDKKFAAEVQQRAEKFDTAVRERQLPVLETALKNENHKWPIALYVIRLPVEDQAVIWRDWLLDDREWEQMYEQFAVKKKDIDLTRAQNEMFTALAGKLGRIVIYSPLTTEERHGLAQRISTEILHEPPPASSKQSQSAQGPGSSNPGSSGLSSAIPESVSGKPPHAATTDTAAPSPDRDMLLWGISGIFLLFVLVVLLLRRLR